MLWLKAIPIQEFGGVFIIMGARLGKLAPNNAVRHERLKERFSPVSKPSNTCGGSASSRGLERKESLLIQQKELHRVSEYR